MSERPSLRKENSMNEGSGPRSPAGRRLQKSFKGLGNVGGSKFNLFDDMSPPTVAAATVPQATAAEEPAAAQVELANAEEKV